MKIVMLPRCNKLLVSLAAWNAIVLTNQPILHARADGGGAAASGAIHATVANRVTEADLTTITLTDEAIRRLAIKVTVVGEGRMARRRLLSGETMAVPGRAVQLTAPFTCTIAAIGDKPIPMPGTTLKKGEPVLGLRPVVMAEREVLTPSERIALARAGADFHAAEAQSEGEVSAARVQLDAAQVRLERAERLRKENATSTKLLDEAKAEHELARTRLDAAQARAAAWKDASAGMQADSALALVVAAPFDCVLADIAVATGEVVASNSLIAMFVATDTLWVRVPVYVGLVDELYLDENVRICGLDGRATPDSPGLERVAGVPTADPGSATVDYYYRIANSRGQYRPRQRVGVLAQLREKQSGSVVPWAAILYDIHGGAWVYEQSQPRQFARRRVEVIAVESGQALLSRGLRAGTGIVTDGAAELFGVEFGAGK